MVTVAQIEAEGLADWRLLAGALHARFRTGSFVKGLALVTAIAQVAEEMNHHPDLDLRYPTLDVRLLSHDVSAVTERDVRLARAISGLAAEQGVAADTAAPRLVELALDTADRDAIAPFWRAVLGLVSQKNDPDALVDPAGRLPLLWFQATTVHEAPRQRFHLDVWVPHDQAQARVAAALDAGGMLVTDEYAPSFWVLADAEGNKACVCTALGRGDGVA